eukprot:6455244-Amphidinium_carterae.2
MSIFSLLAEHEARVSGSCGSHDAEVAADAVPVSTERRQKKPEKVINMPAAGRPRSPDADHVARHKNVYGSERAAAKVCNRCKYINLRPKWSTATQYCLSDGSKACWLLEQPDLLMPWGMYGMKVAL